MITKTTMRRPDETDGPDRITDYNRAGQYFVTAEREYNLAFTYTAAGTMYKGSVIRFDIPQDDTAALPTRPKIGLY